MVPVKLFSTPVGEAEPGVEHTGLVAYRYQSRALGSRATALRNRREAACLEFRTSL